VFASAGLVDAHLLIFREGGIFALQHCTASGLRAMRRRAGDVRRLRDP
jgi:hypothetical protein